MAVGDEIRSGLDQMVAKPWSIRDGNVVPGTDSVGLCNNDAVKLDDDRWSEWRGGRAHQWSAA
ncbi:hypothetical protein ACKI1Q_42695 [Streptomyces galilaeus]|uniref:hypothetical protein n=1 Tax=Streptomyces galilaeus TaxID=33899 RepID=UPI0038F7B7AC